MNTEMNITTPDIVLPGLDCGICGFRKCAELAARLKQEPDLVKRCIHLTALPLSGAPSRGKEHPIPREDGTRTCGDCSSSGMSCSADTWVDSLGREFDFYLEHFPEDPGPREIILPHNPMITREMDIAVGDILIGRPLGMSCGCPITHCGVVTAVDARTGVMTWCVTGPLDPRKKGYKDIGYYIAEAYEGLVKQMRPENLRIGLRYYFQPRMCMLQWRHSGLINYLNRLEDGYQVRLEGLFIG